MVTNILFLLKFNKKAIIEAVPNKGLGKKKLLVQSLSLHYN